MGLFEKLFRKNAPTPPAAGSEMITVYDATGNPLLIRKETWRTSVLPGMLEKHWNDPDQLYAAIVAGFQDGYFAEVLDAAQHLCLTDPQHNRSSCAYGIALLQTNQLEKAEQILKSHNEKYGEDGIVLTNLAKVYQARGEHDRAKATLWHALEVDPNQDNGVIWFAALGHDRDGKRGQIAAWSRVAELPGSWRAQLWLARMALEAGDRQTALAYCQESLERVGGHPPTDYLMQMSGDLGGHGLLDKVLEFVEPLFDPVTHGLPVGNNLIKANLALGHTERAGQIVRQLSLCNRADWRQTLEYWDAQIRSAGK